MNNDYFISNISGNEVYTNALTTLSLTAKDVAGYSDTYYVWDLGDGTTLTGKDVSHVYTQAGNYDITLTLYSALDITAGDPFTTPAETIKAVNLIPNLVNWSSDSSGNDEILASVKHDTPMSIYAFNSYQQYDETMVFDLYAENSKSLPYDDTDKKAHLKPNWRFVDVDDNIITNISIPATKIYAYLDSDSKIVLSDTQTEDSLFVGTSGYGEFYFIDDTPSDILQEENPLPSTVILSQNLSASFGDPKFSNIDYIEYPSIMRTVNIITPEPKQLEITSNGAFDISYIKFANTKIPFTIRLLDENGNYVKTHPFDADNIGDHVINIGFIGDVEVSDSPELVGKLSRFEQESDGNKIGGVYESYFIPTQSTSSTVALSASVKVDYKATSNITRYGIFADENSNTLYKISYIEGNVLTYDRIIDPIGDSEDVDQYYSNKYGMAIDPSYNAIFLDSDSHTIDKYNTSFTYTGGFDLTNISATSPTQLAVDGSGDYWITSFDSKRVSNVSGKYISNGEVVERDIQPTSTLHPVAIEVLSDNEGLIISYISLDGGNKIYKYDIDRNSGETSSGTYLRYNNEVSTSDQQVVDMVSNSDGTTLFALQVDPNTRESFICVYNPDTMVLVNTIPTGYNAEFITIDASQRAWTFGTTTATGNLINLYRVTDTADVINYNPISYFGGDACDDFGGIAGDSYGNVWLLDSDNDRLIIFDSDSPVSPQILALGSSNKNKYVAYGDWNGFRWNNKFANSEFSSIVTYELSGVSNDFKIFDSGVYNIQKINEDFDMTETLKSYVTTDGMREYTQLFDEFFRSIYGDKYDDGTYLGRNLYEKISNFVMNHVDVDHCSIDALKSFCEETGVEFDQDISYPRDIKRLVDLFSIRFKHLWGDDYTTNDYSDLKGDFIDLVEDDYYLSAEPPVSIMAVERFNNNPSIVTPHLSEHEKWLSDDDESWGWGLNVPAGGKVWDYYEFYELLDVETERSESIIDWDNELTDQSIKPISSYDEYMTENGIVSTILGDKLRIGLGLYE